MPPSTQEQVQPARDRVLQQESWKPRSELGLKVVLDAILEQLQGVVDYDSASIMLREGSAWRIIAGRGFPPEIDVSTLTFPSTNGKISSIEATQQPFLSEDVQTNEDWIPLPGLEYIRAWIGAPLVTQHRIVGILNLDKREPGYYTEDHVRLVMAFANQAAVVIENARLLEAERHRSAQLSLIEDISQSVLSILDPEALLDYAAQAIASRFGYYHVDIFLADHGKEYIVFQASSRSEYATRWREQGLRFRIGEEGITGHVAATGQAYIANNVRQDPYYISDLDLTEARSELAVPIKVGDRVLGVLDLNSNQPGAFDQDDLFVAQSLADQLALGLENARLFEEARRRTIQLQVAAEVARGATATLDVDQLLHETVRLISDRFGFYHAGVFLLDEEDRLAVLCAASSEGGQRMLDRGHRLPVGQVGIVGHVAATGKPRIVLNVGSDAVHLANPDLPDTRSEMALPLISRGRTIGVLDVQSVQQAAFTEGDVASLQTMADQLANAIENARLYQETQRRLKELTLLFDTSAAVSISLDSRKVVETTAQQAMAALEAEGCAISIWEEDQNVLVTLYDYGRSMDWWKPDAPGTVYSLVDYPATQQVLKSAAPCVIQAGDPTSDAAETAWMREQGIKTLLMAPMIVWGKVIGLLEVMECETEREFTSTEIRLCQTLANQAAAALENARLFQETEGRMREMAAVAAVGRAMTTLELEEVLDSITENALLAVQAEISSVYLLDEEHRQLHPQSVHGLRQDEAKQVTFELGEGTIGRVAQVGEPLIVHDTAKDPAFVRKAEISKRIRNSLTVPLKVKGQVIGTLEVCNKAGTGSFSSSDERLLAAFAAQAAIAIDNARLYQEVSHHLEEVLLLNKAAVAASTSLDFGDVIRRSLSVLLEMRNYQRVHVLLVDEVKRELWLHPSLKSLLPQGDDFRIPLDEGITGWVARTGEPLRTNDVRQEPRYVEGYKDTLSELAVPLRVGDRTIGVLDVQSTRLNAFSENDQRLLTTLAGQLSTVLANVQLFEEAQQRVRELTALTQVSQALNEATDLTTVLKVVLDEAFDLIGSQEGSIILIDPPDSNQLRMVAEHGLGPELMEVFNARPVYTHEGTYKRALSSGRIVEVADISSDADFLHDVGSKAKQVTNIPLMTERGAIGLIAVDGLPQDDTTRRLLTALADMAAVAIDKERLHQETTNRLAEVSTLYTLSNQITSSLSQKQVLESIVAILRLTLDCRSCSIFLVDQTKEYLRLEAASGPSSSWKGVARLRIGEGVSGRVITERRAIYVPDTHLESDFIFFDPQIRSLLVVPLVVRDEVVGTVSIDDIKPNAFDNEIRLLTIAAAQAAVAIENAQLYESLEQSYTELEQAYHELRDLDKMKSEFVQNISHELRTPLTFIKGYVELLLDGDMGELNEEQEMAIDIVAKKANALSSLVDDIISLQQASRERIQFEVMSLTEVGHAAVQAAKASAAEAGITICDEIPDELPTVLADRQRVSQVFDNLLGNAIKFSNPGDTVTVRMFEQRTHIRTEVEDTGIGIPADKLARIFDRFYQVDGTTTRRFGGTGLGLAITRQIIEAHGGRVGVTSEVDKGSTFHFTIPKADKP